MPYKIKHKSHNECLIEYVGDGKAHKGIKAAQLSVFIFAVMMYLIGMPIGYVFVGAVIILSFIHEDEERSRPNFEIELSRTKNLISIRNSEQIDPKVTSHNLSEFKGFKFVKSKRRQKYKAQTQAEIFLRFKTSGVTFENIPIRNRAYPVPIKNAKDITASVDEWLSLSKRKVTPILEEPVVEPEILRDFRDM